MKKITIPLILLFSALTFSCSADEESQLSKNENNKITPYFESNRWLCTLCDRIQYSPIRPGLAGCPRSLDHNWIKYNRRLTSGIPSKTIYACPFCELIQLGRKHHTTCPNPSSYPNNPGSNHKFHKFY